MLKIDLNADLGEGFGPWQMGDDKELMKLVSSANIACGAHAGDPKTMFESITLAKTNGVSIGAHPGFNDREGFGRRVIPMSTDEINYLCAAQIGAFMGVAAQVGARVNYVKAHGALANLAAREIDVARALVTAVRNIDQDLPVLAISGTQIECAANELSQPVFSEIFADRGYLSTGQLVPRSQDGAMITDANQASDRLIKFMETGLMEVIDGAPIPLKAQSICIHGDSPHALGMARDVRRELTEFGITIEPFVSQK